MEKINCEICAFKNPKATVTAIIIKNNKILLLKRNEEPFKGNWDLPGGYMQEDETPDQTLKREIKEELGIDDTKLTFIKTLPGNGQWKEYYYPILNHFFLTEIAGNIEINKENSEFQFVDLKSINVTDIAFDSNQKIIVELQKKFVFDMVRVKELVNQLDSSVVVDEQSLYKAILNGFIAKKYDGEKLIGLGWIFPRQTILRKQAVIEDMIVDQTYRGKGFGKEILLELIEWAKKEGIDTIELTSNPKRIAANELYKKSGFKLHPTNHYLYFCK